MPIVLSPLTSYSAGDLIRAALLKLRVYKPGESIPDAEMQDNLAVLNTMLDSLSTDTLMAFAYVVETFPLIPNKSVYTIGVNADFNTTRPDSVIEKSCFVRSPTNVDYPLYPMTQQEYNAIALKSTPNSVPRKIWYDSGFPIGTITLDYPPLSSYTLNLVSIKPYTEFPDITTVFAFPAGYRRMFVYNLAVDLSPEYGPVDQLVYDIAKSSKSLIEHQNIRPAKINVSGTLGRSKDFNFFRGD